MDKNYTNEKAKKEWEARNKLASEQEAEILKGATKIESDRLKSGGVNFALYNLVLSVTSFKDCETALDSCRRTYEGIYPYLRRIQNENLDMRKMLADRGCDDYRFKEILETHGDLQLMAAEMLNKITKVARERAKSKIYEGNKPKLVV